MKNQFLSKKTLFGIIAISLATSLLVFPLFYTGQFISIYMSICRFIALLSIFVPWIKYFIHWQQHLSSDEEPQNWMPHLEKQRRFIYTAGTVVSAVMIAYILSFNQYSINPTLYYVLSPLCLIFLLAISLLQISTWNKSGWFYSSKPTAKQIRFREKLKESSSFGDWLKPGVWEKILADKRSSEYFNETGITKSIYNKSKIAASLLHTLYKHGMFDDKYNSKELTLISKKYLQVGSSVERTENRIDNLFDWIGEIK